MSYANPRRLRRDRIASLLDEAAVMGARAAEIALTPGDPEEAERAAVAAVHAARLALSLPLGRSTTRKREGRRRRV